MLFNKYLICFFTELFIIQTRQANMELQNAVVEDRWFGKYK